MSESEPDVESQAKKPRIQTEKLEVAFYYLKSASNAAAPVQIHFNVVPLKRTELDCQPSPLVRPLNI